MTTKVTVLRNPGSRSARRLAASLGVGLATTGSRRRTRGDRFVINWGVSTEQPNFHQRQLTYSNSPLSVANCANKVLTLRSLSGEGVPTIDWVANGDVEKVRRWLVQDGKVVVRHTTTGHSGAGIQIVRRGEAIPEAPLYTRYFRKQAEYRVHMFYGQPILIQQKKRMNEERRQNGDALIRTHANGWVFAVTDLSCDERGYRMELVDLATNAAQAVGANHCAVDILVSHEHNMMAVCEINSAPALEAESTLEAYYKAFSKLLEEMGYEP